LSRNLVRLPEKKEGLEGYTAARRRPRGAGQTPVFANRTPLVRLDGKVNARVNVCEFSRLKRDESTDLNGKTQPRRPCEAKLAERLRRDLKI